MNVVFENRIFRILMFLNIWGLLLVLPGCINEALDTFSKIEVEASKYGTVSAGAVRVKDYNDPELKSARETFRKALVNIQERLIQDINDFNSPSIPEGYEISRSYMKTFLELGFVIGKGQIPQKENVRKPEGQSSTEDDKFLQKMWDTIANKMPMPKPNRIDLMARRMAELKFVESEIEDVNLSEVSPFYPKYRRVMISLDFTAWVRVKAGAVLVYIDLYPFNADAWCHKAANALEEVLKKEKKMEEEKKKESKKSENEKKWEQLLKEYEKKREQLLKEYKKEWKEKLKHLRGFPRKSIKSLKPPRIEGQKDPVGYCHFLLVKHDLLPRIVHIERFSKSEYLTLGQEDYRGLDTWIGANLPKWLSAELGVQASKQTEQLKTSIRPLSLAFIAGERRAGWLFMPSKIEAGKMPPTERRLRMVVDIPKDLSKLGVHVHKLFLGPDLGILPDAAFANQMAELNLTRWKVNKAEDWYGKYKVKEPLLKGLYYASPKNWRLVKSRMRNLLYQGWSEEIVVDIPRLNTNDEKK